MMPKERFLTADEMARLNAVLTRHGFRCPDVVAIIRLLMLTGCRFGEVASLEWGWIKGKHIHLPDSKSGPRTVWLSSAARAVIDGIPRYSEDCPYLFPGRPPNKRHTAASQAVMSGENLPLVGKLLGHRRHRTTANYAHVADAHLIAAAEKVGSIIAEAMDHA